MSEQSCLLVKPDGVQKKVIGKVIDRLEREGFELLALKLVPPGKWVESFYAEHRGREFYPALVEFMQSGPVVATVWEGENVIARIRQIIGATNSQAAAEGTLRREYGTDNRRNLVHASDSPASAAREIPILFSKEEILSKILI